MYAISSSVLPAPVFSETQSRNGKQRPSNCQNRYNWLMKVNIWVHLPYITLSVTFGTKLRTIWIRIMASPGQDSFPVPLTMSQDGRPVKRPRVDGQEHRTDRFDFVSQSLYESADSTTPESPKRSHNKKQPLSCAECRRLKLKVSGIMRSYLSCAF